MNKRIRPLMIVAALAVVGWLAGTAGAVILVNGEPQSFDPNLQAWYAPSSIVGTAGSTITQWDDLAVSSTTAGPLFPGVNANNDPQVVAVPELNGELAVRLDGVEDFLHRTNANPSPVTGASDRTVVAVIANGVPRAHLRNDIEHVLHFGTSGVIDAAYGQVFAQGGGSSGRTIGNHYWDSFDVGTTRAGITPRIISFVYDDDGSLSGPTGLDSYWVNGIAAGAVDVLATGTAAGGHINTGTAEFHVGARVGLGGGGVPVEHMQGDIAEIIIYDEALGAADREALEAHLASKYGIPVAPSAVGSVFYNTGVPNVTESDFAFTGATARPTAGALHLADNIGGQGGAAMLNAPVQFAADYSFNAFFQARIGAAGGSGFDVTGDPAGADGMTFVIHEDPRGPLAMGNGGGDMGIGGGGANAGLVIELDTWHGGLFDVPSNTGTNGDHVAIDVIGVQYSLEQSGPGATGGLNNGVPRNVWVDYNGVSKIMDVTVSTGAKNDPGAATISQHVDLARVFSGNQLYVGFTGATGGATNDHDVLQFSIQQGVGVGPPSEVIKSFADFSDISEFTMNGTTPPTNPLVGSSQRLRLSDNVNSQGNSAMLTDPVILVDDYSFQTEFDFEVSLPNPATGANDPDGPGADGFVFVIHRDPRGATAVGAVGGGFGLAGITPFVAVEFDTWHTGNFDPAANNGVTATHIAVDTSLSATSIAQFPPPGEDNDDGLNEELARFNDGGIHHVRIEYDGQSQLMDIYFWPDGQPEPASPLFSANVDFGAVFGPTNEVFLGFSAGTGGAHNRHEILTWDFTSVPEPSSMMLALVGLAGLVGLVGRQRRR